MKITAERIPTTKYIPGAPAMYNTRKKERNTRADPASCNPTSPIGNRMIAAAIAWQRKRDIDTLYEDKYEDKANAVANLAISEGWSETKPRLYHALFPLTSEPSTGKPSSSTMEKR